VRATFFVPGATHPIGGARVAFEWANHLTRRGHEIHFFHTELEGRRVTTPDDIGWFDLDPRIRHHTIRPDGSTDRLPNADFLFAYYEGFPRDVGLPLNIVQGYRMMRPDVERATYEAPCPKICVAKWLVDVGRETGVPEHELVYVPNGVDHAQYRILRRIDDRPRQVAMLYHPHPMKGTKLGVEALVEVKRRIPELSVVLFGTGVPPAVPEWMTVARLPELEFLVAKIYNGSSVFLCPSIAEGFGFANVEAMACGCALATFANGGSDDYARHADTALVAAGGDVAALADHVEALLSDDPLRVRIARRGRACAREFDWDVSSRRLEAFLDRYAADPDRYLRAPDNGGVRTPGSILFGGERTGT
jgi:glycosyltransferase involved in cell wall biosynthesis